MIVRVFYSGPPAAPAAAAVWVSASGPNLRHKSSARAHWQGRCLRVQAWLEASMVASLSAGETDCEMTETIF